MFRLDSGSKPHRRRVNLPSWDSKSRIILSQWGLLPDNMVCGLPSPKHTTAFGESSASQCQPHPPTQQSHGAGVRTDSVLAFWLVISSFYRPPPHTHTIVKNRFPLKMASTTAPSQKNFSLPLILFCQRSHCQQEQQLILSQLDTLHFFFISEAFSLFMFGNVLFSTLPWCFSFWAIHTSSPPSYPGASLSICY